MPRKAVQEIIKLLGETDDEVSFELTANQARFRIGEVELITKVVDGKFPDYERVLPRAAGRTLSAVRSDLKDALVRTGLAALFTALDLPSEPADGAEGLADVDATVPHTLRCGLDPRRAGTQAGGSRQVWVLRQGSPVAVRAS